MNNLIRSFLAPFVDAMIGAVVAQLLFKFLFGVESPVAVKGAMLVGASIGAAPHILKLATSLSNDTRDLHDLVSNLKKRLPNEKKKVDTLARQEQAIKEDIARKQAERRALLAAEHEARRPICLHCGQKTEPVSQHRRIDGGPDIRYKDNPVLCNRCYKPYSGVRPWNLPPDHPKAEKI